MAMKIYVLGAFLVLAVLPAFAQETVEVRERLPFLPEGGAEYPDHRLTPLILPEWAPVHFAGRADAEEPENPDPAHPPLLHPDVDILLGRHRSLSATIERGIVTFRGPNRIADRIRKRVEAVRAAFARRAKLTVRVTLTGEKRLSHRYSVEVPLGSWLRMDERTEHAYPCRLDLGSKTASAGFRVVKTGPAISALVTEAGKGRTVVRLLLHVSGIVAERRFTGEGPTLVAPVIEFAALDLTLPVTGPGGARVRSVLPHSRGELLVTCRVEMREVKPAPSGTRVYPVAAASDLVEPVPLPDPGRLGEFAFDETATAQVETAIPGDWSLRQGRMSAVSPGLVVAEGAEAALDGLDRDVDAWWWRELPFATFARDPRPNLSPPADGLELWNLSLPLALRGRGWIVHGRITPVADRTEVSICQPIAIVASKLSWVFSGRRLVLDPAGEGGLRVEETVSAPLRLGDRELRLRRTDQEGDAEDRVPFDEGVLDVRRRAAVYPPGRTAEPRGPTTLFNPWSEGGVREGGR